MSDLALREEICRTGARLAARGLSPGTSGNISVRTESGWIVTPTNASLAALDPQRLSRLDEEGRHVDGDPPTKERFLHRAVYEARTDCRAIVHLHSTHAVAYSCLQGLDARSAFPPLTPYTVMRLGDVALVAYARPGDERLGELVGDAARDHHVMLLANHGPVLAGRSLEAASTAAEELEESAKLYFLLHGHAIRLLTDAQVEELRSAFVS